MKSIIIGIILAVVGLTVIPQASAHVTVNPKEMVAGYGMVTVRVPNEKDMPTTAVRLVIPEGVDVSGVMPISGWMHTEIREVKAGETPVIADDGDMAPAGRVSEVRWTGGKITPGEFLEFPLNISSTGEPGKMTFKAYQTYSDGSVVNWDGSDDKHEAPILEILKESRVDTLQAMVNGISAKKTEMPWLPIVAVILSVAAIAVSFKKKS